MEPNSRLCAVFRIERIESRRCKHVNNSDTLIAKYRDDNWTIIVYDNFTAIEMFKKLNSFDSDPYLNCYQVYKFVFIGHGGFIDDIRKNFIFGSDGNAILIEQITDLFEDHKCINLIGKMKYFEFFVCDFVIAPKEDVKNEIKGVIDNREKYRRDLVRDMIVIWSTLSGFVSYRSPEGTHFVVALCKKLKELSEFKEITDILRIVQTEVDSYEEKDGSIKVTEIQTIRFEKLFYFDADKVIAAEPEKKWTVYDTSARRKRKCLIINIKNFQLKSYERRDGSEKDVENIQEQFESLGFEVTVLCDLKQSEIINGIKQFTSKCEDTAAFALFIMSHGGKCRNKNVIYGTDCCTVPVDKVINLFKDEQCPQLKNVPKFVFVVACRGNSEAVANGVKKLNVSHDSVQDKFSELDPTVSTDSTGRLKHLPPTRDLLLLWSRYHRATMREMVSGSRFANYLLQNLMRFLTDASDVEIMQVPRYVDGICKTIGVRKQHIDLNAIGLRKFLYPLRFIRGQYQDNEYALSTYPRGFLFVINNHFFQTLRDTPQNSNDVMGYLTKAFAVLQFEVIEVPNVDSILEKVQEALRDPRIESHDSFFLIISTEIIEANGRQYLVGCNGTKCDVEDLKKLFNEDNCPALRNKPKIIFFFGSNEVELHDERSDEDIAVRNDMEQIFETSLDFIFHLQSGCLVTFYTPFATFYSGNLYIEESVHLRTLLTNINNAIEPTFRHIAIEEDKVEAGARASNTQHISSVLGRLADHTSNELSKFKSRLKLETDEDYHVYFGESLFRINTKLHRSIKSIRKSSQALQCFCEWTEVNGTINKTLTEEELD